MNSPNTLQDLRATLDHHAGDVHDDPSAARVAAVRGRVRRSRQQRAGAVVVGAVLAVVGAVLMPTLGGSTPQRGDRWLAGHEAPASITSLGYTYRFAEGVQSTERKPARLRLPRSDAPRLVTWASEADDVVVDVNVEGESATSTATDFDDFVLLPGAGGEVVTLRAGGAESALAVYELDADELPDGITGQGLTFRERVGSDRLLDAAVGETGTPEITLEVTVPESERLRIAEFCRGVPTGENLWVNTSVDGDGALSSGGCDDPVFDPAVGNASWLEDRHLPEPGETVSIRMWISRGVGRRAEPVTLDGAQLAVAAYDTGRPVANVAGWEIPQLHEHDGHLWSLVTTEEAPRGAGRSAYTNPGDRTLLVEASLSGAGDRPVTFREPSQGGITRTGTGSGSGMFGVLRPGRTASLTVRGEPEPATRLGFALYERVG